MGVGSSGYSLPRLFVVYPSSSSLLAALLESLTKYFAANKPPRRCQWPVCCRADHQHHDGAGAVCIGLLSTLFRLDPFGGRGGWERERERERMRSRKGSTRPQEGNIPSNYPGIHPSTFITICHQQGIKLLFRRKPQTGNFIKREGGGNGLSHRAVGLRNTCCLFDSQLL